MNKIWLIAKREYLTRVRSKTFILTTFLTPLGIVLLIVIVGFIMTRGSDTQKNILVRDVTGLTKQDLESRKNITYTYSTDDIALLKQKYLDGEIDGILDIIPLDSVNVQRHNIMFYSDDRLALDEIESIEDAVSDKVREYKVKALDLDEAKISLLRTNINIEQEAIKDQDKKVSTTGTIVGSVLGGIISYAMFFIIFLYGAQVMRSVMEEKINRIVEVLISSVKPFELMMGKILGVGSVGLTQIGIWLVIFVAVGMLVPQFVNIPMGTSEISEMAGVSQEDLGAIVSQNERDFVKIFKEVLQMNWIVLIPLILFYFFMGYFAYAALFAAVGSAVGEDINEAQSLTLPVMLPLILAIYIGVAAINSPNSTIAIWGSIIPLTSSIVMPVRLPLEPPVWQIILSVVLLIAFVIFMVWIAGRIYRIGILMYGKKASFKELGKWLFYKS